MVIHLWGSFSVISSPRKELFFMLGLLCISIWKIQLKDSSIQSPFAMEACVNNNNQHYDIEGATELCITKLQSNLYLNADNSIYQVFLLKNDEHTRAIWWTRKMYTRICAKIMACHLSSTWYSSASCKFLCSRFRRAPEFIYYLLFIIITIHGINPLVQRDNNAGRHNTYITKYRIYYK